MPQQLTERQLLQTVYWEDVFSLMEEQQDCWDGALKIFQQLRHQNADPRILEYLNVVIQNMAAAFQAMEAIENCFSPEPKIPVQSNPVSIPTNSGPFRY